MKVFITTDWHFGVYVNNLDKWLNMMEDYFYNFFIPYLKENVKEGDILVHCGDLYDNRTSIPIIASYKAEKILTEISKIIPVHLIVGNHDLWNKGSNDINSVRLFNFVENINVYIEPSLTEEEKDLVLQHLLEQINVLDDKIKPFNLLDLRPDILNIVGDFVKRREIKELMDEEQIINGKTIEIGRYFIAPSHPSRR